MSDVTSTETTLTGAKLWIIVGLLVFMAVLTVVGICVPSAQEFITKSISWLQAMVGSVGAMK